MNNTRIRGFSIEQNKYLCFFLVSKDNANNKKMFSKFYFSIDLPQKERERERKIQANERIKQKNSSFYVSIMQ